MKKIIVLIIVAIMGLSGCANLSERQNQILISSLGVIAGTGVGAAVGGGKGAAIGAAVGGTLGALAAYALASDPFTQSVSQQADVWKNQTGVQPETIKASEVIDDGEKKQQIDVQKMAISESEAVANNQLLPVVKQQLSEGKKVLSKIGGEILVRYPPNTPATVLQDILSTGVNVSQDNSLKDGYMIYSARNRESLREYF